MTRPDLACLRRFTQLVSVSPRAFSVSKVNTAKTFFIAALAGALISPGAVMGLDVSSDLGLESRSYFEDADAGQSDQSFSLALETEFYHRFENDSSITFTPFVRWDSEDDERTHADIRELVWNYVGDDWELKAGISKVFWGVAESQHLVDIINQTDLVENPDQEDKLGQPMIQVSLVRDYGVIDLFVLPYFRERTFAGEDGRLRPIFEIDTDNPRYESSQEQRHIDLAARWSHVIGDWDIGVAHFSGTSREPILELFVTPAGAQQLRPFYPQIDQTSIDLQATIEAWLWKLEAFHRSGFGDEDYFAAVGGFEYSFYGVAGTDADLGLILEYQYDERDTEPSGFPVLDTTVGGLRLALNDVQSTEFLLGVSVDEEGGNFYNLEASRRLGDSWKLSVEARFFTGIDDDDLFTNPFFSVRNDDYLQITLETFF